MVVAAIALTLLAGCSAGSTGSTSAQAGTSAPAASAGQGATSAANGRIAGQITAINGSSWTVRTSDGQNLTVTTTPSTAYGSSKHPATAQSFAVGQNVRITGTRDGNTVTATRIRKQGKKQSS
jgi:hypothetical protein